MTDKHRGGSPKARAGRETRLSPWPLVIVMALPVLSALLRFSLWVTLVLSLLGTALLVFSPHLGTKRPRDPKNAWHHLMACYTSLKSAYAALKESPSDAAALERFSILKAECLSLLGSRSDSDWGSDSGYVVKVRNEIVEMSAEAALKAGSPAPVPGKEIGELTDLKMKGLISGREYDAFSERFKVLAAEKARGVLETMAGLQRQCREGAMTQDNYHAALWSLLDKVDRGESDAAPGPATPARSDGERGRADTEVAQAVAQGQDAARGSPAGMKVTVEEVRPERLTEYARIPISFEVQRVLRVESPGPGQWGFRLVEELVSLPYVKDYDVSDDPDGRVLNWARRFDVSNWGFLLAHDGNETVGAVTVALRTPAVHMLEDRSDLAVLWDLRVRPERRRQGFGTSLFRHAADWALSKGCRQMKVETQNTNLPACRFYARQGFVLGGINRFGYAAVPAVAHETMLLWYIDLGNPWART